MGQYWMPVNLDKKEYVDPHKLGTGLKLWEQLANHPGTGAALILLCAAHRERRGGGDLDVTENWHGPERTFPKHNTSPGPMPDDYAAVARRTIGRWAGDRIALVGNYAEDGDLPEEFRASTIYERCQPQTEQVWSKRKPSADKKPIRDMVPGSEHYGQYYYWRETAPAEFRDISDDVARVIEHELQGKYSGSGWRDWTQNPEPTN